MDTLTMTIGTGLPEPLRSQLTVASLGDEIHIHVVGQLRRVEAELIEVTTVGGNVRFVLGSTDVEFPEPLRSQLTVASLGDEIHIHVVGQLRRVEAELIEVTTVGGNVRFVLGSTDVELAVTEVRLA